MTRFFKMMVIAIVLFGVSTSLAFAQINDTRQTYLNNPYYKKMAITAWEEMPPLFGFTQLRSLYSRTSQYDPLSEETLKTLNDLAYLALNEQDEARSKAAFFGFETTLKDHLANLEVVMQALSLAREDQRFGDVKVLEWAREGLIHSVLVSGKGNTLDQAYDVVTIGEESVLLGRLGLKSLKAESVQNGGVFYSVHQVQDLKTREIISVFVNTSIPMRYLQGLKLQQEKNFSLNIRKQ